MEHSLGLVPPDRDGFWIGNMIPTVIDDDIDAARARNRKTLQGYLHHLRQRIGEGLETDRSGATRCGSVSSTSTSGCSAERCRRSVH